MTRLCKRSRIDTTEQEIQECHDWALFPYFLDFWPWNFFLFVLFLISRFLPIIAVFCLLLQLFPFLSVFNFFIDFFYIFTRLCRSWVSAVPQSHTCTVFVVSLIMLRAVIIRLSPAVPFGQAVRTAVSHLMRPFAWLLGAVVPVRPATRRRRARRPFGIYKRHVGPNGSDGSALFAWLFFDLG